jgi:hypothetical protein
MTLTLTLPVVLALAALLVVLSVGFYALGAEHERRDWLEWNSPLAVFARQQEHDRFWNEWYRTHPPAQPEEEPGADGGRP